MSSVLDISAYRPQWLKGSGLFKIRHISLVTGYHDEIDVPKALIYARKHGLLERNLDLEHASYFISRITIARGESTEMSSWRKFLFVAMARNAASPIEAFKLPADRTATAGSMVGL